MMLGLIMGVPPAAGVEEPEFAGGNGSASDPFRIETAGQLDKVRNYLGSEHADKHFVLINDIDLTAYLASDAAGYNSGARWEPIGSAANPFKGSLDGNGKTIRGLKSIRASSDYVGLFGYAADACLQNIYLEGVAITGLQCVGALAGYSQNCCITNCQSSGKVQGNAYSGGLAGYNEKGFITDSFSASEVVVNYHTAGGLTGYNSGAITRSCVQGSVEANSRAGGLVGHNHSGMIEDSYALVKVKGLSGFAGGLAGINWQGGHIKKSYAAGIVSGPSNLGGLVGNNDLNSTVTASYYDSQTSRQADIGKGLPRTTAEMKQSATFAGWDFTAVWKIVEGYTYPRLFWQPWTEDEEIRLALADLDWEQIKGSNSSESSITENLVLPASGAFSTTINWSADKDGWLDPSDGTITRPAYSEGDKEICLTATVSKGTGTSQVKTFLLIVKAASAPTTLSGITPADDIEVDYGSSEAQVIALLAAVTTIIDSAAQTYYVDLNWTIADFDGYASGIYIATATFALPGGVLPADPESELKVTARVTVRERVSSSNADLSSLKISEGVLQPEFSPSITSYTATVSNRVTKLVIIPVTADSRASLTINGGKTAEFSLSEGSNVFCILVTAEDGVTVRNYILTVTRIAPPRGNDSGQSTFPSSNQSLTDIAPQKTAGKPPELPIPLTNPIMPGDLSGSWAENIIIKLITAGVISGYPDGTFQPEHSITRAEFIVMLVKALRLEKQSNRTFADITYHWARESISAAAAQGLVSGYDLNRFGPDEVITREQAVLIIARAVRLETADQAVDFTDSQQISPWARSGLNAAVKNGFICGYPDHSFKPHGHTTRAEAAVLIAKLIY